MFPPWEHGFNHLPLQRRLEQGRYMYKVRHYSKTRTYVSRNRRITFAYVRTSGSRFLENVLMNSLLNDFDRELDAKAPYLRRCVTLSSWKVLFSRPTIKRNNTSSLTSSLDTHPRLLAYDKLDARHEATQATIWLSMDWTYERRYKWKSSWKVRYAFRTRFPRLMIKFPENLIRAVAR